MFPIVVILITLYTFYVRWDMLNRYRGLILADTTFALPLAIMLMKAFFDTIPRSLDEAARIDGAGRFRTLFSVLLPLTKPGLIAVGSYTFLTAWDDFLMSLVIMQKNEFKTLTVGIAQSFLGEYAHDYGALMAFSVAGSLPIVLAFILFQRHMIAGLTSGAVKG
jgi:multiple sugar transport system permease protein